MPVCFLLVSSLTTPAYLPADRLMLLHWLPQVFDVELRQVRKCERRQMMMFSDVVCE